MTNAELAIYYRSVAVLYDRLAALDERDARLATLETERNEVVAARTQCATELEVTLAPLGIPDIQTTPPVVKLG
jgi:hypothetical protein